VRNRIDPVPPLDISFEEISGVTVTRIAVARGDAQAYFMNGIIYVRYGSTDVQAGPEDLKRLVMEFGY
jgi:predicted HTH transcriptional regulator